MGEPQTEVPDQKVEDEGIEVLTIMEKKKIESVRAPQQQWGVGVLHCMTRLLSVPPHELTEEEKLQILHSEEFADFFDHSTRIIERALSEHVDLFFDYSGRDLEEKEG